MDKSLLEIKEVSEKKEWEDFLLSQENPPFLQSWNSANQAEALGEKTLKLGIYSNKSLIGVCLIILVRARRGSYLYAPYGPVFAEFKLKYLQSLTIYLKKWGRDNKFDFIRIVPYLEKSKKTSMLFKSAGYKTAPIHMLSEIVWKLDLAPSEDDLLMAMRKTTRNLIRRALKDGVNIKRSTDKKDIEQLTKLMVETHKRHHFVPYPDKLYYEQVKSFADDNQVLVFTGSYDNQVIASSIIMYYGKTASYHHGASIRSKVPVAYLLQWEAIREAKKRGCKEYSFWGIVESDNPKHPFYGITKFKKGFGGEKRYLIPSQDYPLSNKYYLTYLIESIRRIKRGFGWKRV